jgi:hypothetical protein
LEGGQKKNPGILNIELDGGRWSLSRSSPHYPRETSRFTHPKGERTDPRTGLNAVENRFSCHPTFHLVNIPTEVSHLLNVSIIANIPNEVNKNCQIIHEYKGTNGKTGSFQHIHTINDIYPFDIRPLLYIFGRLCYEINTSIHRFPYTVPAVTLNSRILPKVYVYEFCVILAINSDCLSKQH